MRLLVLTLLFAVLATATAAAQTAVGDAANALRANSVYVAADAQPGLSPSQADALRATIRDADAGPVYVAVLPEAALDETGGSIDQLLRSVYEATGRPGTYAVVAGHRLRAGSDTVSGVGSVADNAVSAHADEGLPAILTAFV